MAVNFPSGFSITNTDAIDVRMLKTRAEMYSAPEPRMPQYYFCICTDGPDAGKVFIYDKSLAQKDETYGKFRLLSYEDLGNLPSLEGVELKGELTAEDLGLVTEEEIEGLYRKPSTGIPYDDLSDGVKESLDKADSALQSQAQANWDEDDDSQPSFIQNKPDVSVEQTATSISVNSVELNVASSTQVGLLSASDYDAFSSKQDQLTQGSGILISNNTISVNLSESNIPTLSISKINGLQSAIDAKQNAITTGALTGLLTSNMTPNVVAISDSTGKLVSSTLPVSKMMYLSNVASDIQAQLNSKASAVKPIDDWSSEVTYSKGSTVISTYNDEEGFIYISLVDNNYKYNPEEYLDEKWKLIQGGGGVEPTEPIAFVIGNGVSTEFVLTHNFHSYNFFTAFRSTVGEREYVEAKVVAKSLDEAKVIFTEPPATDAITVIFTPGQAFEPGQIYQGVVYEQETPSDEWVITTYSSARPAVVEVTDSDGKTVEGIVTQTMTDDKYDHVVIQFNEAISGKAILI